MDYLPGFFSSAYFTMHLSHNVEPAGRVTALLEAGSRIQRFWLNVTKIGLALQPCLATLAFAHYGKTGLPFTADRKALRGSKKLAALLERTVGPNLDDCVFIGRIGYPRQRPPSCRSTRLALDSLLVGSAGPLHQVDRHS